jgi:hypothetical protein
MGLVISKGLTLRKDYRSAFADPDVQAYLSAVEQADGQALEYPVAYAVDEFVRGCKADGIWDAIKASCILAGARTRLGALTPLVGTAPTSFNFVDGDYNRKTGLVGDGSTKYLDSNRNNNADPQNSHHQCLFVSTLRTSGFVYIGAGPDITGTSMILQLSTNAFAARSRNDFANSASVPTAGFWGVSRASSANYNYRFTGNSAVFSRVSQTPYNGNTFVFGNNGGAGLSAPVNARLAFYSIGESLDIALLDARVTDLINAFGAAIP